MRIGGGIPKPYNNPNEWIALVKDLGYSTVLVPVSYDASKEEKKEYLSYIQKYDLVLGEVGIWRNVLSLDKAEQRTAMEFSKNQLMLAEEMGANCCINVAGARGEIWDGCYKDNYSADAYQLIIDLTREIIDSVKPMRTFYAIEPMPWMVPDSPDAYLKLIKDVDRPGFAVHLDYTNMINNPRLFVHSSDFISECFQKLGPFIKSIHAKDVRMYENLPCCIEEVMPGSGSIDFSHVLRLCEGLGKDTTVFVEHMDQYDDYKNSVAYLRGIAEGENITIL